MKSTELRIGNYLQDSISKTLLKVVEIKENGFSNYVIDRTKFPLPAGWMAEGIPITEEWLLKFGFKLIHKANKHYAILNPNGYKDLHKIHFFPTINEQWHLAFSDSTSGKDETHIPATHIKYVHELQNIYYALTKDELVYRAQKS